MTNVDGEPVPIPEDVMDAVIKALEAGNFSILDELDPSRRELAVIYLTRLIAYKTMPRE